MNLLQYQFPREAISSNKSREFFKKFWYREKLVWTCWEHTKQRKAYVYHLISLFLLAQKKNSKLDGE